MGLRECQACQQRAPQSKKDHLSSVAQTPWTVSLIWPDFALFCYTTYKERRRQCLVLPWVPDDLCWGREPVLRVLGRQALGRILRRRRLVLLLARAEQRPWAAGRWTDGMRGVEEQKPRSVGAGVLDSVCTPQKTRVAPQLPEIRKADQVSKRSEKNFGTTNTLLE